MVEAPDSFASSQGDPAGFSSPIPPGASVVVFDFQIDDDDEWTVRCTWCGWSENGVGGESPMHEATMAHRNSRHPDTWVPDNDTP